MRLRIWVLVQFMLKCLARVGGTQDKSHCLRWGTGTYWLGTLLLVSPSLSKPSSTPVLCAVTKERLGKQQQQLRPGP